MRKLSINKKKMGSQTPIEEVMAAGPAVKVSNLPGLSTHTSSSSPPMQQSQLPQHQNPSKSGEGEDSYSLTHSNSQSQGSLAHSQSYSLSSKSFSKPKQTKGVEEKESSSKESKNEEIKYHHRGLLPRRRQESFDLNGWPEGIEKPTRFLGMRVKPVSQWSIKHIFCLSY